MNKKMVLILGGAAAVVALCLCAFVAMIGLGVLGGVGATQPVADAGEKFMQSLKAGDYETAYGLCHPALQQKLGSTQGLKKLIEGGKAQPTKWSFSSRNLDNDRGHLEGTVTTSGGEGTVTLDLSKSGSDWKVSAFNIQPN
jgi:hypothetical protein